jgi:hypothetical protein
VVGSLSAFHEGLYCTEFVPWLFELASRFVMLKHYSDYRLFSAGLEPVKNRKTTVRMSLGRGSKDVPSELR